MSYENKQILNFNGKMKVITGESDCLKIYNRNFKIVKHRNI